jgi:putative transcriptional regulator
MTNKKVKSRIIEEMKGTVKGLHAAGAITKKSMEEFEALRHLTVKPMTARRIKQLRHKTHLSQAVFALAINTSLSTIQKWEAGDKRPSGTSLKLLSLIEKKGLEVVL